MKQAFTFASTVVFLTSISVGLAQSGFVEEIKPGPQIAPAPKPTATPPRAALVSQPPEPSPDPAAEREAYTVANALYTGGKYAEAIPHLRNFLDRFPKSLEATEMSYKLGDALRRTGETAQALKILTTIYEEKKDTPYAPFAAMRLAEMLMAQGQMSNALPLLDAAISSAPTTGLRLNAIYAKIIALQNLGRISETPELLDQLTSVRDGNPYLAFADLALGRYYESTSDFDTALRHYNRALAQSTTADIRAEAGTRAGVLALRQGQHTEAISLFDTTLRLDPPENWRQLSQLGLMRTQAAAGKYTDFLRSWDVFEIKLPPTLEPEFLYLRANALRSISPPNAEAARQLYNQIIENHSQSPYAEHAAYELLLLRHNESEPAEKLIPSLRNFLDKYPGSSHTPTIRYLLAKSLTDVGKQNQALPLLLENIEQGQPKELIPEMRLQAALCLMAAEKPRDALKQLNATLEETPDGPLTESALHLTALAQESAELYDDALATWDALVTRFPNTSHRLQALFRTGLIHARANRWPETRRAMRSLLAASPDFSNAREARFWKGLAAYHEGDFEESKNDLSQVLDTATQNDTLLLPTLQHLLIIATKEQDLETAEPLACTYLDAAEENADAPPLSPELLLWLASSCEKLGQHTQAVFWYEKLLPAAVDKNMKTLACAGLAKTRLALGLAEDALEAINLLQKNDPSMLEAPEILLLHAGALIANRKPKDALPLAEKVLSDSKDPLLSARARILIGDSYANLDQHQEALKYYTSASLLYDDPEVTPEALRKSAATAKKLGLHDEALNYERDLKQRYGMNSK